MKDGNFFSIGDLKIHYAESPKNGPTIIMLHGGGGTWESFLTVTPTLEKRWHLIALDFRGQGQSERTSDYRFETYAQDVITFIQSRFGQAVTIWGQSLGANIAIQVAATQPQLVSALVLEEPAVDFSEIDVARSFLELMRNLAASGKSYEQIRDEIANIPVPIPGQDQPARLGELRGEEYTSFTAKCIHALDPLVFDFILDGRAFENYNIENTFGLVSCPTLFLQGNPLLMGMTDEVAKYGVSLIPDCKHVYVEDAGHNLHRTQPDTVIKVVEEFLASMI
ncbi:MAG TPA: alpha/beta hydrolase [Anaerolineales bacterium]|nr:alpha/beta hydrolase [Anaerolineales bacterium]